MAISRPSLLAATAALALAGCGGATPAPAPDPGVTRFSRVLPLDRLFVLEATGVPPEDTVVTFPTGADRRIILRHAAPDNTTFLELWFPATTFAGAGTPDSVTVAVHPRPGVYGAEVTSTLPLGPGALIRFKYPVHFAAPVAALRRYGGATQVERALSVAALLPGGSWGLLASERPASDNLQAPLPAPGIYLVVAPR